jgi:hypothetical protein
MSHRLDIFVTLLQSNLEVCVTAITCKLVIRPRCGEDARRLALRPRGVVIRQTGKVRLEPVDEHLIALFLGRGSDERCDVFGAGAVEVEEQGGMGCVAWESGKVASLLVPAFWIGL